MLKGLRDYLESKTYHRSDAQPALSPLEARIQALVDYGVPREDAERLAAVLDPVWSYLPSVIEHADMLERSS